MTRLRSIGSATLHDHRRTAGFACAGRRETEGAAVEMWIAASAVQRGAIRSVYLAPSR